MANTSIPTKKIIFKFTFAFLKKIFWLRNRKANEKRKLIIIIISLKGTKKLINGENVSIDESGLSKREWNELMISCNLQDKLI